MSDATDSQPNTEPQTAQVLPASTTPQPVAYPPPRSTMEMVQQAIMNGASMELVERLMALHERYETTQARKAFYEAKAKFKAVSPKIIKDRENTQFKSKYASIGNLVNTANEKLAEFGLDTQWNVTQDGKDIIVTCILTHVDGHFEKVSLSSPPDTSGGGSKNPIQQIKSTMTYLKIATYEAVTGLATKEGNEDDDGNSAGGIISDEQAQLLEDLATSTDADKIKFCRYFKIDKISSLPSKEFNRAKGMLEGKRK